MDVLCNSIITNIKNIDTVEEVISVLLRDIFMNDLIDVDYRNEWRQYDTQIKKWKFFMDKDFGNKIKKLDRLFSEVLIDHVIKSEDITNMDKVILRRKISEINRYISDNDNINLELINSKCKKLFSIDC